MALAIALEILAEVENRGGYLSRSQVDALKAALSEIDGWKKVLAQAKSDLETGFIPSAHGHLMDIIHALPHSLIANHLPPAGKRVSESDLASMPIIQAVPVNKEQPSEDEVRQFLLFRGHLDEDPPSPGAPTLVQRLRFFSTWPGACIYLNGSDFKLLAEALSAQSATLPPAVSALLEAYREERRLRKSIHDQMCEEAKRGNLWQNSWCRDWAAYEKVTAEIPAAVDTALSYVGEKK